MASVTAAAHARLLRGAASCPYKTSLILLAKSPMHMHDRPPYAQNTEPFQWLEGGLRWRFYLAVFQSPCLPERTIPPFLFGPSPQPEAVRSRSWHGSRDQPREQSRLYGELVRANRRRGGRVCGRAGIAFAMQVGCKFRAVQSCCEKRVSRQFLTRIEPAKAACRCGSPTGKEQAWRCNRASLISCSRPLMRGSS